jgi:hypothetical protein
MKTILLKISFIFLLMSLMGAGCEKDEELLREIYPDSKTSAIQIELDGIEFKFCLLNEKGEPGTVFNQGENFTFYFSFSNNMKDPIIVTTEFISSDFFRVYRSLDNNDMGKPWTGVWCNYSLAPQEINLAPSNIKQLFCPWILTQDNTPEYPLCMSESKDYLAKGKYETSFNLDFHFTMNGKKNIINGLIFKINFEIK